MPARPLQDAFAHAAPLTTVAVVLFGSCGVASEPPTDGKVPCSVQLVVANPVVIQGAQFDISFEVKNTSSQPISILNPLHLDLMPIESRKLLLFDREGNCVGDLVAAHRLAGSSIASPIWQTLPPGAILGVTARANASILRKGDQILAPGVYRLQLVFLDRFVSESPYIGAPPASVGLEQDPQRSERWKRWLENHPGVELFRSNAVELVVVQENQPAAR